MARAEATVSRAIGRRRDETGRLTGGTPDWALVAGVLGLVLVGLVFVLSSSFAVGQQVYGDPHYFVQRQLAGAGLGLIAFVVLARLDYRRLRALSALVMMLAVVGLLAVLIPGVGVEQNGAQRWVQISTAPPIQPSEFTKLAVVVYVAAWLASRGEAIRHISLGLVPFSIIVGFLGFLIMAEPDLGTAITISLVAVTMFFMAGAALRHMAALAVLGGGVLVGIIGLFGYGLDRFTQFVDAESNPEAGGFQTLQLLIALGSGGLTGVGLGESRQKFFYIPSAHTDGVFAVIGEETGLLGAGLVLVLFVFVVWRGFRIAKQAPDAFGMLLAIGVTSWIGVQAFFNLGGISRTIPMTGIPLPLISFGSSALVATLAGAGILVSVSRFGLQAAPPAEAKPPARRRDYAGPATRREEAMP